MDSPNLVYAHSGGKIKMTKLHADCYMIKPESSTWTTITFYTCIQSSISTRRRVLALPDSSIEDNRTIPMVVGHKATTSLFRIIAFVHCLLLAVDPLHCIFFLHCTFLYRYYNFCKVFSYITKDLLCLQT
jgi:hypothetical protein